MLSGNPGSNEDLEKLWVKVTVDLKSDLRCSLVETEPALDLIDMAQPLPEQAAKLAVSAAESPANSRSSVSS